MQSIRRRLNSNLIICAVIAIFLSALFVNFTIVNSFRRYVEGNQEKRNMRIVDFLGETYKRDGKWSKNSGIELLHEAYMSNYCLTLMDNNKNIIWAMNPEDIRTKTHIKMMEGSSKGIYKTKDFDIVVDGKVVGYVTIGQYSSILLSQDDVNFKFAINKSIAASIMIAVIFTIIMSLIISKEFSIPIKEVSDTSISLSDGNYEARSNFKSDIVEIENLKESINDLGEKLKEQDAIRKRLVSDITHEIRTPLNILQNNLEAMIDGVYDITTERLEALNEEVIRFGRLLNSLNALKELDTAEMLVNRKVFSINELILSVIEDFSLAISNKEIKLDVMLEKEKSYFIEGDYDRLKQVFINLLSNSVKFTGKGGKINIELSENDSFVIFGLKDNGIGIRKEDLPFIFERLYRGDKSRNKIKGHGIGLTVVKKILDLHDAHIDVKSSEGNGTIFKIYFKKAL